MNNFLSFFIEVYVSEVSEYIKKIGPGLTLAGLSIFVLF